MPSCSRRCDSASLAPGAPPLPWPASARPASRQSRRPKASVLLLTLVVVALLTLGAMSFFERMFVENRAVDAHVRQTQARYLAESGVQYLRALLIQDPTILVQSGGKFNNPLLFQGKLVNAAELPEFRGRFTVIAPQMNADGYYGGIRYGLENESAKLNLNTLLLADEFEENGARNLLMALPGMNESIADAILDWIDEDEEQRMLGAERDYYSSLDPPYAPRNGPLGSIEELLLVRGVTPALLFGADLNRNALVDQSEQPYTVIDGVDNSFGALNRGWAAYFTIDSAESNTRADGTPKIDINMSDLQELYNQAAPLLGDEMAQFVVAFRQGGPYDGNDDGQPASGLTIDFNQPGRVELSNLLDLVGVSTRVAEQGTQGSEPTVVDPAFPEDTSSMRDYLPKLFDNFAVNSAESIPGRINVNQAARTLLMGIPGLELNTIDQIIATRDQEVTPERPGRAYETWLLTEGIVELDEMKQLMPLVTAGGDVYRAQVVGYFEAEGPAFRLETVIDATSTPPTVRRRRELAEQGPGFPLDMLGVVAEDEPQAE